MAGQIKSVIDFIIEKRSSGNQSIASATKTILILRGVYPEKYDSKSQDEPRVLSKIMPMAKALGYAA
ncbi:MAG: hypothetical protein ACLFSQ_12835 [Candidatus Zixiibacteriota bacterium]